MSRMAWVDVFASGPMTGNPLAVVLDAADWDDARMQSFAAELGISETTFVLPSNRADHRVRIFTPRRELPMAGHPIVGTAWVLHASGRIGEQAVLETGAGHLPVRVNGQVATMEQATPAAGPVVDAAEVAAALGAEVLPDPAPRVWSTGVNQLMARVPAGDLEGLRPDHDALSRLGERDGWIGVSAYVLPDEPDGLLRVDVRHFAPLIGVPEDPVTGSAAGALGACLAAARGDGDLEMVVRQGGSLGRAGEVAVRVASSDGAPRRVRVGGRVVPLFEGRVLEAASDVTPDGGRYPTEADVEGPAVSDPEDARRRVRQLLLSGDNTLKNRDDPASRERARARFQQALELARDAGIDDAVAIIERRLALMEPPATAS